MHKFSLFLEKSTLDSILKNINIKKSNTSSLINLWKQIQAINGMTVEDFCNAYNLKPNEFTAFLNGTMPEMRYIVKEYVTEMINFDGSRICERYIRGKCNLSKCGLVHEDRNPIEETYHIKLINEAYNKLNSLQVKFLIFIDERVTSLPLKTQDAHLLFIVAGRNIKYKNHTVIPTMSVSFDNIRTTMAMTAFDLSLTISPTIDFIFLSKDLSMAELVRRLAFHSGRRCFVTREVKSLVDPYKTFNIPK